MDLVQAIEIITKFTLCVLLTQFGKTFTAIGRIKEEIKRDERGFSIHLVWTMNTLLNNAQFSNRLNSIEEEYGKGSVVVFASKNQGHQYRHIKNLVELQGVCLDTHTCPRVIVMCSNDVRFSDGFKFANILEGNTTNIQRVFAYYDELPAYITDKLRNQIEELDKLNIVKDILALTATPDKILLKTSGYWSNIRTIRLNDFNETDYAGCADMTFNLVDDFFSKDYKRPGPFDFDAHDADNIGFVRHVLDKNPNILENGSRTFIPAHKRRSGHKMIRREVFKRRPDAVVVVLNGEEKTLQHHDQIHFVDTNGREKTISLNSATEEVCETITRIINTYRLEGRPLVITGFLCVGMGQTLIHRSLGTFTSAIISHLDLTNDDIYQLFGRLTARSKSWGDKYVPTQVYCPTVAMHRIIAMEECARNLAKEHNGQVITEADYRAPLANLGPIGEAAIANIRPKKEKKVKVVKPSPIEHDVAFLTETEVNTFLTNIFKKPVHVRSFVTKDGYVMSTRLPAYYGKTKDQLTKDDRLSLEFFRKIKMGMNISRVEGAGQQYMVYPVYPTKESPPGDLRYYVRYMKPTEMAVTP
jgi:hypothetical protein